MFRRKHEHFLTTRLSRSLPMSESFKYKVSSSGAPLMLCTLGTPLHLYPPPQISTCTSRVNWKRSYIRHFSLALPYLPSNFSQSCSVHWNMTGVDGIHRWPLHTSLWVGSPAERIWGLQKRGVTIFILLTSHLPARSLGIDCVSLLKITAPSQHLSPLKYPLWVPVNPLSSCLLGLSGKNPLFCLMSGYYIHPHSLP